MMLAFVATGIDEAMIDRLVRTFYGSRGFFDRTLASMTAKPRAFDVGYSELFLPTIYPQPHEPPNGFDRDRNRGCNACAR